LAILVVLVAVLGTIAAWWLSQQRLTSKPWLEQGVIDQSAAMRTALVPPIKIGLGVFLAVIFSLFALFGSAYAMRMHMGDWQTLPKPGLLWVNTAVLVASSVAMGMAQVAARRGDLLRMRQGMLAGAATALLFILGQLLVWRQLVAEGFYLTGNPANSFFYLLTTVHGLHIAGGLVALGRAGAGLWRGAGLDRIRLNVELCAIYWHFLLLVWLYLLAILLHG
jgi:cytochrome c oxidase subunit 3